MSMCMRNPVSRSVPSRCSLETDELFGGERSIDAIDAGACEHVRGNTDVGEVHVPIGV